MIFLYGEKMHVVVTYDARSKVTEVEVGNKSMGIFTGYHPRDLDELPFVFMEDYIKFCIRWHEDDKGDVFVLEIDGVNVENYDYLDPALRKTHYPSLVSTN